MVSTNSSQRTEQSSKTFYKSAHPLPELTPNQSMVLDTLASLNRSAGAYELLDLLRSKGVNAAPTIYRALNQLEAKGLVRHLASTRYFTALADKSEAEEDRIMLVCEHCGTVSSIRSSSMTEALKGNAERSGFQAHSKHLELIGTCESCRLKEPLKKQDPTCLNNPGHMR